MSCPRFSSFIWGLIFFCYGSSPLVADTRFDHSLDVVPERSLELTSLKGKGLQGFFGQFRGQDESDERFGKTLGGHHSPHSHHAFRDVPGTTFPDHDHRASFRVSKRVEPIKPSPQVRVEINGHPGPDPHTGDKSESGLRSSYTTYEGEKSSEGTTRQGKSIGPSLTYGVPSSTKTGRFSYRPEDIYSSFSGEISDTSGEKAFPFPKRVITQVYIPRARDNRVQQSPTSFRLEGVQFSRPGSFEAFTEPREVDEGGDTSGEIFHRGEIEFSQPRGLVRTSLRSFRGGSKEGRYSPGGRFIGSQRFTKERHRPVGASREKSRKLPQKSEEIKFSHPHPFVPNKYQGFALRDRFREVHKSHDVKFTHPHRQVTTSDHRLRQRARDKSQELIYDRSQEFQRSHNIKFTHPHKHEATSHHPPREGVRDESQELIHDRSQEFQRSHNIKFTHPQNHVTTSEHHLRQGLRDKFQELINDRSQKFQRLHNIKFMHPHKHEITSDHPPIEGVRDESEELIHDRSQEFQRSHNIKFTYPQKHVKSSYNPTQESVRDKSQEIIRDRSQEFQRSHNIKFTHPHKYITIHDHRQREDVRDESQKIIHDRSHEFQRSHNTKFTHPHKYVTISDHHPRDMSREFQRSHNIKFMYPQKHVKSSYHHAQEGVRDKSQELIRDRSQEFQRSHNIQLTHPLRHVTTSDHHPREGKREKSQEIILDVSQIHQRSHEIKSAYPHRYVTIGHHHLRGHVRDKSQGLIHAPQEVKYRLHQTLKTKTPHSHGFTIVRSEGFRHGLRDKSQELSHHSKEAQLPRTRGFTTKNSHDRVPFFHSSSDEEKSSRPQETVSKSYHPFSSNERSLELPHKSNPFAYLPPPRDSKNKFLGYGDHILDKSFELPQKSEEGVISVLHFPVKGNRNNLRGNVELGINFQSQVGFKDDSNEVSRKVPVPSFSSQNERRGPFEFYIPNISGRTYFPSISSQKDPKESDEKVNTISRSEEAEDKEEPNADSLESSLNTEGRMLQDDFDFDEFINGPERSLKITDSKEDEEEERFLDDERVRVDNSIGLTTPSRELAIQSNSQNDIINDISIQDTFLSSIGSRNKENVLARTSLNAPLSQKNSEASFNYQSNESVEKDSDGNPKLPPPFDAINSLASYPLFNPFKLLVNQDKGPKDINTQFVGAINKKDARKLGFEIEIKNATFSGIPSSEALRSRAGVDIDRITENKKPMESIMTFEGVSNSGNPLDLSNNKENRPDIVLNLDDMPDMFPNGEGMIGTFPDISNEETMFPKSEKGGQSFLLGRLRTNPLFLSKLIDVERSNRLISEIKEQIDLELEKEETLSEKESSQKRIEPTRVSQFEEQPERSNQNKNQETETIDKNFLNESRISPFEEESNIEMDVERTPLFEKSQKNAGHKQMLVSSFKRRTEEKKPIPMRIMISRRGVDTITNEGVRQIIKERRERQSNNRQGKETPQEGTFTQNTQDKFISSMKRPQPRRRHNGWIHQTPRTSFSCKDPLSDGYFADAETDCKVFHLCHGLQQDTFVCPEGTSFSQDLGVCVWRFTNKCHG